MTVDQHELYVASHEGEQPASNLRRFLRELALQDVLVFVYLLGLNYAVLRAPQSAARTMHFTHVFGLLAFHGVTIVAIRSRALTHRWITPALYRIATYGTVQMSYFLFADFLPFVSPHSLDRELYGLDLSLFGVEPAMFFDRFVTPITTEWFAFFYFAYFFVLALHVLPILFLSKNVTLLTEFALGMLIMFCVGHTFYMLVPGYGPYRAMPEAFAHPLSSGVWWNTTEALVARSGAHKDIFPSLHTAAPLFILLMSVHRRRELPFKYTWPIVAFFAANIIIATMFLRWHYVIDVLAGMLLAVIAHLLSSHTAEREPLRRRLLGLGPIWPEWP
jgi:membrane-associated phospholipid phosphatase